MTRRLFLVLLLGINLILMGCLVSALNQSRRGSSSSAEELASAPSTLRPVPDSSPNTTKSVTAVPRPNTPFTKMYSPEPRQFAANLRAIHCPEETVKDIIVAEISRRYKTQEEALHPKPADHVPIGWSPRTSEGRLLERRHQATTLAREKAALVEEALGCGVPVAIPLYARTAADWRFETQLADLSESKSRALRQAHEEYWVQVQALQGRTKGFWQSEDVAELERLKSERQRTIQKVLETP